MSEKMQPIIIVKTGTMKQSHISRLRRNGICVVESDNPDSVRFCEPPPYGYTAQEQAAIALFREINGTHVYGKTWGRQELHAMYAEILVKGTPLQYVTKAKS